MRRASGERGGGAHTGCGSRLLLREARVMDDHVVVTNSRWSGIHGQRISQGAPRFLKNHFPTPAPPNLPEDLSLAQLLRTYQMHFLPVVVVPTGGTGMVVGVGVISYQPLLPPLSEMPSGSR